MAVSFAARLGAGGLGLAAALLASTALAQDANTVRMALGADPSGFNPARYAAGDDSVGYRLLFSPLVRRGLAGELTTGLASGWEQASDTEYLFAIQPQATCSDGTPITAEVVADSLRYIENPETGLSFRNTIFGPGRVEISAEADGRVKLALPGAFPGLLAGLSIPMAGIICPAGLADLDGLQRGTVAGAFSGPYGLAEAQPGVRYRFQLRDGYDNWPEFQRGMEGRAPEQLIYSVNADSAALTNQLLGGELDKIGLPISAIERLEGNDRFGIASYVLATDTLYFNQSATSVFHNNPDLRRAVLQAIDREAVTEVTTDGRAQPVNTVLFPSIGCGNDDASLFPEYDPAAAAALLKGVKIRINASPSTKVPLEYIQASLTALGAEVTMMAGDNAEANTRVRTQPELWDLAMANITNFAGAQDGPFALVIGKSVDEGGQNLSRAANAEATDLLNQARAAATLEAQCELIVKAEQAGIRAADFMPMQSYERFVGYRAGMISGVLPGLNDDSTIRLLDTY